MADQREPPPLDDDNYEESEEFSDVTLTHADGYDEKSNDDEVPPALVESVEENVDVSLEVEEATVEVANEPSIDPVQHEVIEDDEDLFKNASSFATSAPKPSPPMERTKPTEKMPEPSTYVQADDIETEEGGNDIVIDVSDPHKVGDGMNAYMSYKVHTKTAMPTFKRPDLIVDRRFSDFLGLHEKMLAKHRHAGRVVPPAPEKNLVGMTLVKMSKSDEEAVSIDFVEKRRAALERYLNRVARHPVLVQDQDFRDFLEQEDLPPATNTRALSGAGVMRLVKNVEGALNKITIKMTEEDTWFEEKQQQIENLEQQLKKLHATFEGLVHHRKELAVNTAMFAKSAATLGNAEEHTALSRALAQLSDAFEKIESVHQDQSNTDYYGVAETLADYLRIISEIKEVFMIRVKSWQNWQNSVQTVNRKKESEAKMQAAGKQDKVSQIQADLRELEARVETSKSDFDDLSATIKRDVQKFELDRIADFRELVLIFLKNLMKSQEQCMKNWEGFMPEARAIA